jgi:hypothetical protein
MTGDDPVGDVGRQRFHGDLAGDVLEHATALDAGSAFCALELDDDLGLDRLVEAHLLQVDVLEVSAHRVVLLLLDDDRHRFAALDLQIEQGRAFGEDVAHLALGHLEGARVGAAAVDDAGNEAVAAQPARGSRAELAARSSLELFAGLSHRGRRG